MNQTLVTIAKWTNVIFGAYLIGVGILMLFAPQKANNILRKAGSTPRINYAEITIRMIPAIALILFADHSKFPLAFEYLGWFMLVTSCILLFVPRRLHHKYAVTWADILKPFYVRMLFPFSVAFGGLVIYSVL